MKRRKKIVACFLAFAMILGCVSDTWLNVGATTENAKAAPVSIDTLDIITGFESNPSNIYTYVPSGTTGLTSDSTWQNRFAPAEDDAESGIYLNGIKITLLYGGLAYQGSAGKVGFYLEGFTATNPGDHLVMKGTYYSKKTGESFTLTSPVTFEWNGSVWTKVTAYTTYSGSVDIADAQTTNSSDTDANAASHLYFKGSTSLNNYKVVAEDWSVKLEALDEESGVFFNGTKISNSKAFFKYNDWGNWWFAEGFKATKAGDKVTVKGTFIQETQKVKIEIAESTFVWEGTRWITEAEASVHYVEVTFKTLNVATVYKGGKGWYFYFDPSAVLPGTADSTRYTGIQMSVDGVKSNVTIYKAAHMGTALAYVDEAVLPGEFTKNTKIVFHAGKAKSNDGSDGIELKSDFVIYANQYGISTDGYLVPTQYVDVTFGAIDQATGFSDGKGWMFYVSPSTVLPGTADSTRYTGLKYTVDNKEYSTTVYKTAHSGTALFVIDETALPKDITKDTKIVLKAGKAKSNDGSNGINLTKDYVIYANEYGISTTGFMKKPTLIQSDAKLTLDKVTMYGGTENGLYLTTNDKFPTDTSWTTGIYASENDKNSGVFVNGKKVNAPLKRYANGKLYVALKDAGVTAKDKDKVTVKGTFYLGEKAISYKTVSWYFNGKIWGDTYTAAKKESYTEITAKSLNAASGYSERSNSWNIYLETDKKLPGVGDQISFKGLNAVVNNKTLDVTTYHAAHMDTLFFTIDEKTVSGYSAAGTKITLKAGKALATDQSTGIRLKKDVVIYVNKYGVSLTRFMKKPTLVQKSVPLELARDTMYGGTENGLYLLTSDKFPTDDTWGTRIFASDKDKNSGVFLNGKKIAAPLNRYSDGRVYVALSDAGVKAKNKDKVTVKGTFYLGEKAISYKTTSWYFNGKIWGDTYTKPKPETYTPITVKDVNTAAAYTKKLNRWNVYLNTNEKLPGVGDQIFFTGLKAIVKGKTVDVVTYHAAYQDTLFMVIDDKYLAGNVPDGTRVTLKAGKALAPDKSTGIQLKKDYTFYVYKGMLTGIKPTTNTKWKEISVLGLNSTARFSETAKAWLVHYKLNEKLVTEPGTKYIEMPLVINNKKYTVPAQQDGEYLLLSIPESALPANTKTATLKAPKGGKAYANAGHDGVKFKEDFEFYLFHGAISERKFTEVEETELRVLGVQSVFTNETSYGVYLQVNKEFPGTAWYEHYDFTYYYNGKEITCDLRKSESSNNRYIYFPIELEKTGKSKEGDEIKIKAGTVMMCGGYRITVTDDFLLRYEDGLWTRYMKTDVKAPEAIPSIWDIARFDTEYIPSGNNGSVLYSNEDTYNKITSLEPMKDYTVSFKAKKVYDDELTPTFSLILRGNAISEEDEMTKSMLYGYVISFSALEKKEDPDSDEPGIWTQYIELWKNGVNSSLLDQYRVHFTYNRTDHPFFRYDKEYDYKFAIYNVTDTCVCIEAYINDKLVMRYYDEAGSDPLDPAVNAGTFQILAGCPNYITDDVAELAEVISEKDECKVGEKVRCAVSYPYEAEGSEFKVDKEGATITDGMFSAEKPGTYTISGSYNGKKLADKQIVVTEAETAEAKAGNFPVVPVVATVAGVAALILAASGIILMKKRKKVEDKDA